MRLTWIIYSLIVMVSGFYVMTKFIADKHNSNVRSSFYRGCTMGQAKIARDNGIELSEIDVAEYCENNAQLFTETLEKLSGQ